MQKSLAEVKISYDHTSEYGTTGILLDGIPLRTILDRLDNKTIDHLVDEVNSFIETASQANLCAGDLIEALLQTRKNTPVLQTALEEEVALFYLLGAKTVQWHNLAQKMIIVDVITNNEFDTITEGIELSTLKWYAKTNSKYPLAVAVIFFSGAVSYIMRQLNTNPLYIVQLLASND